MHFFRRPSQSRTQEGYNDEDFPRTGSRLELVVDFAADVPEATRGRYLAQPRRNLAARAEAGKATVTELEGESSPGEIQADAKNRRHAPQVTPPVMCIRPL